jgi:Ca2+/H+ antiporter, TMEM165/GDT1 family
MQNTMRRNKWFFIPFLAAAFIGAMGFVVMSLWNNVLVYAAHVSPVNFWQALGLFILAKIFFTGFRGGHWGRHRWNQKMQQKWMNMSPEEKEKFKEEWKTRCMGRRFSQEKPAE